MDETLTLSAPPESSEHITKRVSFLLDLLHCNEEIYYSLYESCGTLLFNNQVPLLFDHVLRRSQALEQIIAQASATRHPFMISTGSGMTWCAVYEADSEHLEAFRIHLFGPCFTIVPSDETINKLATSHNVPLHWRPHFVSHLQNIPVITATSLIKYTLMLHYAVTGKYLQPSDIQISRTANDVASASPAKIGKAADRLALEDQIMSLIRTGDIYYPIKNGGTAAIIQHMYPETDKNLPGIIQATTIFIGLCIRAGIDGGLSPDTAFLKGENYLADLLSCENMVSVLQLCHEAFEDFLYSVHNLQNVPHYSKEIQACVDYIEMHCTEEISIKHLAPLIGYTDYYLSRKFKSEVGMSINSYIKKARIDHASFLLVTTQMSIQEITDKLCFGNRSFFSKVFKEYMGVTPVEFRESHRHKL